MWQAVLFIRVHGLAAGQTGVWLGVTAGVAGVIGVMLGGYFADRLGARRPGLIRAAPIIGLVATAPFMLAGYMHPDWRIALMLLFLPFVANNMYYGPTFSCVQRLVRPAARAMAAALMLFMMNPWGSASARCSSACSPTSVLGWRPERALGARGRRHAGLRARPVLLARQPPPGARAARLMRRWRPAAPPGPLRWRARKDDP